MLVKELNSAKATRRCLKCGKPMWTDRCHRICTKCGHANEGLAEPRVARSPDLRDLLHSLAAQGHIEHGAAPHRFGRAARDREHERNCR